MKLRIACVFAVVILVGAIVASLWDLRERSPGSSPPPVVEGISQVGSERTPEIRGPEKLPMAVPPTSVQPGVSKPVSPQPAVVSNVPPPGGNLPPPPVPNGAKPPASPPAPPAIPNAPGAPPSPPQPDVVAKAVIELDQVGLMLRDYRTRMGENPVGPNAEIMKAVMGGNPKKARLGPPEGQQVNGNGELVDRWGTPYFFHQVARTDMEIRSAGPDRKMWTDDDIVGR